jgi:hypothetical protein
MYKNFQQVNITRAIANNPNLETKASLHNPNLIYRSRANLSMMYPHCFEGANEKHPKYEIYFTIRYFKLLILNEQCKHIKLEECNNIIKQW